MDIKISLTTDDDNPTVGDLYLGHGTVRLTATLAEEVAQELRIRLRFFRGEWFLDETQGVPYYEKILGQKTARGIVEQIFRRIIIGCPGVASLDAFAITSPSTARSVSLTFTCTLADGTTLTSEDFGPFVVGET